MGPQTLRVGDDARRGVREAVGRVMTRQVASVDGGLRFANPPYGIGERCFCCVQGVNLGE